MQSRARLRLPQCEAARSRDLRAIGADRLTCRDTCHAIRRPGHSTARLAWRVSRKGGGDRDRRPARVGRPLGHGPDLVGVGVAGSLSGPGGGFSGPRGGYLVFVELGEVVRCHE